MICKMCATGADMRARSLEIRDDLVSFKATLDVTGQALHQFCKGATACDCQHKETLNG